MDCICGNHTYETITGHPQARIVNDKGETVLCFDPFIIGKCNFCGLIRQIDPPVTDYSQYPPTKDAYSGKSYEHDLLVSQIRLETYKRKMEAHFPSIDGFPSCKSLDIGSGSGAMIETLQKESWDAYGCELSSYKMEKNSNKVYRKDFLMIHFPTDHFQLVTAHDVIEHVYDPKKFAEELFRVTDERGTAIVEIPDFFEKGYNGEHHWKHEHIWYFTQMEMYDLLQSAGFLIFDWYCPIPGKITFLLRKPVQKRTKILFPPGIGDCYWSLIKLQDFIQKKGIKGQPEVSVVCPRPKKFDAHKRAFPFLEMFPFLKSTGETLESKLPEHNLIWKEAYQKKGRMVFDNVMGYDYFIALNGQMRFGASPDDLPYKTNWYPPRFVSLEESQFEENFKRDHPRYIVFYFVFHGIYERWVEDLGGYENLVMFVRGLCSELDAKPIFVGADWDEADETLRKFLKNFSPESNWAGKTTVAQLFGLLKGSEMCVGFPSGLTIMSPVIGVKTFTLWNKYYHEKFFWNVVPPDCSKGMYFALNTKYQTPEGLIWKAKLFFADGKRKMTSYRGSEVVPQKKKDIKLYTTVVCVLRSGGDYDQDYVIKLKNSVKRNTTKNIDFVCLTDMEINDPEIRTERLISDYPGWWSKVEIFRSEIYKTENVLYVDLDTVILKNIDELLEPSDHFSSIVPWNAIRRRKGEIASGIMKFRTADLRFIYEEFSMGLISDYSSGDQEYIGESLRNHGVYRTVIPKMTHGILSYKRDCQRCGIGDRACVVCFHGRPRPHEVKNIPWMKENWK